MADPKMHVDELEIDVALVRRLLATQFPEWADLSIEPVRPRGTDNALYRLGDELVARLPRRAQNVPSLEKECRWLPVLAPQLPLAVPIPVAIGEPSEDYPLMWAVYRWLPGKPLTDVAAADVHELVRDLAALIGALQDVDSAGGPQAGRHNFGRGQPLVRRDEATRAALTALRDTIDGERLTAVWNDALHAAEWNAPALWIHGDLDARNLLLVEGRLRAVIDFGSLGVGDPAYDVMVAWKVFGTEARDAFRSALSVDDATWSRARGLAVSQAVIALAYYTLETNAVLVRESQRWLREALAG